MYLGILYIKIEWVMLLVARLRGCLSISIIKKKIALTQLDQMVTSCRLSIIKFNGLVITCIKYLDLFFGFINFLVIDFLSFRFKIRTVCCGVHCSYEPRNILKQNNFWNIFCFHFTIKIKIVKRMDTNLLLLINIQNKFIIWPAAAFVENK